MEGYRIFNKTYQLTQGLDLITRIHMSLLYRLCLFLREEQNSPTLTLRFFGTEEKAQEVFEKARVYLEQKGILARPT